jgi:hypothetical protein
MGALFMITPFIGLFLILAGGVGLFVTNTNLAFGDTLWIQGIITYGVFTIIGIAIVICIIISGPEVD